MANDYFSNVIQCKDGTLIYGGNIAYYLVPSTDLTEETGKVEIPPIEEVMSISYVPYADASDFEVAETTLNAKYLPSGAESTFNTSLKRIKKLKENQRHVARFEPYDYITGKTVGGAYHWQNEGKLWHYPYHYTEFWDGVSQPLQVDIRYLDFTKSYQSVEIRYALTTLGVYQLFVSGYKGDEWGLLFGRQNKGISMPTSNSAYLNYWSNHQASLNASRLQSGMNVINQAMTLNPISIAQGVGNAIMDEVNRYATFTDLKAQGFSAKDGDNEGLFGLQMSTQLTKYTYGLSEEQLNQIGLDMNRYGYTQNKIMTPNLTSRKYWNYVKTNGVNLKVASCPKEHLEQMKNIFDNGVTVWHVENGGMFENLDKDNTEV